MKVELYKILRKKTTYLLLIPLLIPILYGIGLNSNLMLSQDGESVEFISSGIGLFEFIYTMIATSYFFFTFILVVISSLNMAREIENHEINLYAWRIGRRSKIVGAKFLALLILIIAYYIIIILFSTVVYLLSSDIRNYGIYDIVGSGYVKYIVAILALCIGSIIIALFCLLVGIKFRTFSTFSSTFVIYIMSMYFENFSKIKMFIPEQFAKNIVLANNVSWNDIQYFICYVVYIFVLYITSVVFISKKEL